jgi:tRNA-splicing ligase RtcB
MEITGEKGTAIVYAKEIDEATEKEIKEIMGSPCAEGANVRIMPDCHAGAGCVIGTTMLIKDKVIPNVVGVDVGCGLLCYSLGQKDFLEAELAKLDAFINAKIPAGFETRTTPGKSPEAVRAIAELDSLACKNAIDQKDRVACSLGTLGGGNHFISVEKGKTGAYLVIHTGSRSLGTQMADHYQKLAIAQCRTVESASFRDETAAEIARLKAGSEEDRKSINAYVAKRSELKKLIAGMPDDLCYVSGQPFEDYIHDMGIAQDFAKANRRQICRDIVGFLYQEGIVSEPYSEKNVMESIHNYIDIEHMILRKGAISARLGEKCIIPLNMRDGTLLATGKGNDDWNQSAPHGAGRKLSRSEAKREVKMEDYAKSMEGIYSTSVCPSTVDESPFAYKDASDIEDAIRPTVDVYDRLRPVYNFKSKSDGHPWEKDKKKAD